MTQSAIASCWSHSRCLDLSLIGELNSEHREYKKLVKKKTIDNICLLLSNQVLSGPIDRNLTKADVSNWIEFDDDPLPLLISRSCEILYELD